MAPPAGGGGGGEGREWLGTFATLSAAERAADLMAIKSAGAQAQTNFPLEVPAAGACCSCGVPMEARHRGLRYPCRPFATPTEL